MTNIICNECETVAHCMNNGCVPKQPAYRAVKTYHGGEPVYVAEQPAQQEPVAWQLWVGADTPLNDPMGWQFYSTYNSLKSAEVSARTINSYQQAPFAKLVPLYTSPPAGDTRSLKHRIAELEALLERQTARIVDLQTHIDNFEGEQ